MNVKTFMGIPLSKKREKSFMRVFSLLEKLPQLNIVEIGRTRKEGEWDGAGYSTILFSKYLQNKNGKFLSVDIDSHTEKVCQNIFEKFFIDYNSEKIEFVNKDAIKYFKDYGDKEIDLLFLDAWDYEGTDEDKKISEDKHLEIMKILEKNNPKYVLIDDIFDNENFSGKGAKVIPYLVEKGYKIIENNYMVLLSRVEGDEFEESENEYEQLMTPEDFFEKTYGKERREKDPKKVIVTISDSPLSTTGVGNQTKFFIEGLLETGRYRFFCLAMARAHSNMNPVFVGDYGDDWIIMPLDDKEKASTLRGILDAVRPDVFWMMTDPRFYYWVWDMENEIRDKVPIVYYHVWDNLPLPTFNKPYYESTDVVVSISKLTDHIVRNVAPSVETYYLPHAVEPEIFKKYPEEETIEFLKQRIPSFPLDRNKQFIFYWANRNQRRKMPANLLYWFDKFTKLFAPNAILMMLTDPFEMEGNNILEIIQNLNMKDRVYVIGGRHDREMMAHLNNFAHCAINISEAEGFGLNVLEALACGTPVVGNLTGGIKDQLTAKKPVGVGIEPKCKYIIGSQDIPAIFEDRILESDFIQAMKKIYNTSKPMLEKMGENAIEHVRENFNFEDYKRKWVEIIDHTVEKHGSWPTKTYKKWSIETI